MKYDASSAGVEPGGLTTQNDIKILICYILKSVSTPLTKKDLFEAIQNKALANYFDIADCFTSLIKNNHIKEVEQESFTVTESGEEIANSLEVHLPYSVKEKALKTAFSLLHKAKIQKENKVEINETNYGFNVTCHISGGDFDLMTFTLYVPDMHQAEMVKENFHKSPEAVYKLMLGTLADESGVLDTI